MLRILTWNRAGCAYRGSRHPVIGNYSSFVLQTGNPLRFRFRELQPHADAATVLFDENRAEIFQLRLQPRDGPIVRYVELRSKSWMTTSSIPERMLSLPRVISTRALAALHCDPIIMLPSFGNWWRANLVLSLSGFKVAQ